MKKLISLFLAVVMLITMASTNLFFANAATDEFAGGSGTENDPYLISTKAHLNKVRYYLNAHFKMVADIEFIDADFSKGGDFYNSGKGWSPIGTDSSSAFTGTFDGDGHTIKNLYTDISGMSPKYAGLFGVNRGTIKNVGMVDGSVSASSSSSSFDFGFPYVEVGGIAGYNDEGTITNCYNASSVSASSSVAYAGGIAGDNSGTITDCYNTGSVLASSSSDLYAYSGGIVGCTYDGTITNCYNTGSVSATVSSSSHSAYAGGIAGYNDEGTITNCYNTGSVSAFSHHSFAYAGGIAGYNHKGTITNCYNTSSVSAFSPESFAYAGGIVGCVYDGTITNCYNTGSVSISTSSSLYKAYVGGIAGENSGTITDCYNTGSVSATTYSSSTYSDAFAYAGGIAGYNDDGTITDCYNTSFVSATASSSPSYSDAFAYAGGIVGCTYDGAITNCYNTSSVSASSSSGGDVYAGGIAGYNDDGTITNCYYLDITAKGVGDGTDTATKCTAKQIKAQSTFVGFDFETVWTFDNTLICHNLPVLKDVTHVESKNPHDYEMAYNNDQHYEKCSICENTKNFVNHSFTNGCDTDCNAGCGFTRVTSHVYTNACDTSCNVCGAPRNITHSFGAYVYNNDATVQNDGTKTRTCSVCNHKETVSARGTKLVDSSKRFTDVPAGAWYKNFVDYAVTNGIFNGTGATTFSPETKLTRAQFVMILANVAGIDVSNNKVASGFTDVAQGKWYTGAVTWASKNGIVNGVGNGKFAPESEVTREQMCVMLVNFVENYQKSSLRPIKSVAKFTDDKKISSWAKSAVYKCANAGLVNGVGNNKFDPASSATRAQGATIFTNFHKEYMN